MASSPTLKVILKGVVSFYRHNQDTPVDRQRAHILLDSKLDLHKFKQHADHFWGLKSKALKFGISSNYEIRLYKTSTSAKDPKGRTKDTYIINTDAQWQLESVDMIKYPENHEFNIKYSGKFKIFW